MEELVALGVDKQVNFDLFQEKYSQPRTRAARQVEQVVFGHEVGLNGYTTVASGGGKR